VVAGSRSRGLRSATRSIATPLPGAAQEEGPPDNAGPAVCGGLVLAAHRPTQLTLHRDLAVALVVPDHAISTKAARDLLPPAVPRDTAVAQAARSAALVLGLTWGDPDLIDFGMDDRLAVPHRRQLIKGYDAAVRAALDAGAYGVTISGAGSALGGARPCGRGRGGQPVGSRGTEPPRGRWRRACLRRG
jgi:homoserine kinase